MAPLSNQELNWCKRSPGQPSSKMRERQALQIDDIKFEKEYDLPAIVQQVCSISEIQRM